MRASEFERTDIYAPGEIQELYADCPECDKPYSFGVVAPAQPTEICCSRCGTLYIAELPIEGDDIGTTRLL
jgi:hypothetical protein